MTQHVSNKKSRSRVGPVHLKHFVVCFESLGKCVCFKLFPKLLEPLLACKFKGQEKETPEVVNLAMDFRVMSRCMVHETAASISSSKPSQLPARRFSDLRSSWAAMVRENTGALGAATGATIGAAPAPGRDLQRAKGKARRRQKRRKRRAIVPAASSPGTSTPKPS